MADVEGIDLYADVEEFGQPEDGTGDAHSVPPDNSDLYDDVITAPNTDLPQDDAKVGTLPSAANNMNNARRWTLYVGNLTWWTTDQDMADALASIGVTDLLEVKFFENRANGQSKGFCIISLGSDQAMRNVMNQLPRKDIHGQSPSVTFANKTNLNKLESQSTAGEDRGRYNNQGNRHQNNQPNRGGSFNRGGPRNGPSMGPPNQNGPMFQGNRGPMNNGMNGPMQGGPMQMQGPMGGPGPMPGGPGQMPGPPMQGGIQFAPQNGGPQRGGGGPGPRGPMQVQMGAPMGGPPIQNMGQQGGMRGPQPMQPGPYQPGPGMQQGPNMQGPVVGQPQGMGVPMGPPQGQPMMIGGAPGITQHIQPGAPAPHVNPAFLAQGGPPTSQAPPGGPQMGSDPYRQQPGGPPAGPGGYQPDNYRPPDRLEPPQPQISDAEFEEILQRNKTVSSSAISRAVQDASAGEYASAIETLVTAISLIKQSKIAGDDRCKILISSLQDTLHGIEAKSYGSKSDRRSRSRERDRDRHDRKRHRSRSHERDGYRERSRERDYDRRERDYRSSRH